MAYIQGDADIGDSPDRDCLFNRVQYGEREMQL